MSYRLGDRSNSEISQALANRQMSKRALEEKAANNLTYAGGSPVNQPAERYAGGLLSGEYASMIANPEEAGALRQWMDLYFNGPFSPLPPPVA